MTQHKGKPSILTFPNMWDEKQEEVTLYKRVGQEAINGWGAQRRAFLSSCIKDREWQGDCEDCELKFHGETRYAKTRDN